MGKTLEAFLKQKIKQRSHHMITFAEYMEDCLYHPQYGYYMQAQPKIGKEGDFYTASSMHPVFAESIAHFVLRLFEAWHKPVAFCEMGAGDGSFASAFLQTCQKHYPQQYEHMTYIIIEKSPYHQQQQQERLINHSPVVHWLEEMDPSSPFKGVLFSTELVDAFPVHVVENVEGHLYEVCVSWNEEAQHLEEQLTPLQSEQVPHHAHIHSYLTANHLQLFEGQRLEIPLAAQQWAFDVNDWVQEGVWLTIDYGYTTEELLQSERKNGTLQCYFKHEVDHQPLQKPGQKDMTYHIHFDALLHQAESQGWEKLQFCGQDQFLLTAGILDLLQEHQGGGDPFHDPVLKNNRAIRQLISPDDISSVFRVLALARNVPSQVRQMFTPFRWGEHLPD